MKSLDNIPASGDHKEMAWDHKEMDLDGQKPLFVGTTAKKYVIHQLRAGLYL